MRTKRETQITVRVSQEMKDRIFSVSAKLGITPSELIRQALVLYLNQLDKGERHD